MSYKLKKYAPNAIWRTLWQTLLVFFFIYEVQPIGIPDILTSRKLVFFLCAALFIIKRNLKIGLPSNTTMVGRSLNELLLLSVIMLVWVVILTVVNNIGTSVNGESILSRTLLFVFFTPMICYFMYDLFDNLDQFSVAVFFATILQAVIAIAQYFSDSVKHFLYDHFVLDTNYSYLSPFRAAGLGAGEALLSINLFIGMVAGAYLLIKKRNVLLYTAGYVFILFATMLSGSTGFALGLTLLLLAVLYLVIGRLSLKGWGIMLMGVVAITVLFAVYSDFFASIEDFQIYKKLSDFLKGGVENSHFVKSLQAQEVAPISIETLLGTSIYRGYSSSGVLNRSDTGYLQAYFGYGLIMAVAFYFCLYKCMLKNVFVIKDKDTKLLMLFFFAAIAIVEAKEPFIQHYGLPFAFFMSVFLYQKQEQNKKFLSQEVK